MMHVYYTRIDPFYDNSFFEKKLSYVSEVRRKKVLSYKNQADRCRSLAVGLLFMYGCDQAEFKRDVIIGENGKPQLVQPNAYFNLSHAGDYAVAAFSDRPVGIDVECCGRFCKISQNTKDLMEAETQAEKRLQRIVCKIFTPQEMENWENIPSDDISARESGLIRTWTRKEAFAKMKGNGLSMDFSLVDTCGEEQFLSWKLGNSCWVSVCREKQF